jgi:hypothetical protein
MKDAHNDYMFSNWDVSTHQAINAIFSEKESVFGYSLNPGTFL